MTRLILIAITVLAAGCYARPELEEYAAGSVRWSDVDAAAEEQAFGQLAGLDRSTFDKAWKNLVEADYRQIRSISVSDQDGDVVGHATQTIDFSGRAGNRNVSISASDSTGSFERSLWSLFYDPEISATAQESAQEMWPSMVLPDDPLFLSDQGRSFFRYAVAGDTLIGGASVTMIETAVRPDASREGIQWARFYLQEATLVGIDVTLAQRSLLYHELSDFRIGLAPIDTGEWLPNQVVLESSVGLPFARTRYYRLSVDYRDIRPQ